MTIFGKTYVPARDKTRLEKQLKRVFNFMADQHPHTLADIAKATKAPEASVSARLRQLRQMGHTIQRTRLAGGLHVYRLVTAPRMEL